MTKPVPLTYSDYINDRAVVEALRLPPRPLGVDPAEWPDVSSFAPGQDWPSRAPWRHEEVLFIRTHQAFEVWFAQVIHEIHSVLDQAQDLFSTHGGTIPRVELDRRRDEHPGFDAAAFPRVGVAVQKCVDQYGSDRRGAFDAFGNPGRLGESVGLPFTHALDKDLDSALNTWTSRLLRAEAALACTVPFFDVLATMSPSQFLLFRDRLQPASGFGSGQFRELELILGMRELNEPKMRPPGGTAEREPGAEPPPPPMLRPTEQTPAVLRGTSFYVSLPVWARARVAARYNAPSLRDLVYALLSCACEWGGDARATHPHAVLTRLPDLSQTAIDGFAARNVERTAADFHRGLRPGPLDPASSGALGEALASVDRALAHREVIAGALLEMHEPDSRLNQFMSAAQRVDAALLRWRDRHIRFVESIIGMRRGTGGGGIQYLRGTTSPVRGPHYTHALPCIWQSRSFVQRSE